MHAHQYTYDLHQVANYLNKQMTDTYHVRTEQVKEWAEYGCFPVLKKEEGYRVAPEVMSLVEETRNLILVEGHPIEDAKMMLQLMVREKEVQYNEEQKWKLLHEQNPKEFDVLFKQLHYDLTQMSNGNILALTDTEASIHQKMDTSEDKIRGAIINSEVRIKNVLELVDKRLQKQLQAVTDMMEKSYGKPELELQKLLFEMEEMRQRHHVELAGVRRKYEETIRLMQVNFSEAEAEMTQTIEQQMAEIIEHTATCEEVMRNQKQVYEEAYDLLIGASFWERRKLKQQWKVKKGKHN